LLGDLRSFRPRWRHPLYESSDALRQLPLILISEFSGQGVPPGDNTISCRSEYGLSWVGFEISPCHFAGDRFDALAHMDGVAAEGSPIDAIVLGDLSVASDSAFGSVRLDALGAEVAGEVAAPRAKGFLPDVEAHALLTDGLDHQVDVWVRFVGVKRESVSVFVSELFAREVAHGRENFFRRCAGGHGEDELMDEFRGFAAVGG
jgi:hypothetical protein